MSSRLIYTKQAFFICTLLVVAFPIWPIRWAAGFIVLWFSTSIISLILNGKKDWTKNLALLLLFASLFLYYAVSFLFVEMPEGSIHYLERSLSLLVFPLGFYFVDPGFQKKQRNWLLLTFELASFVLTAYIAFDTIPIIVKHWDKVKMGTEFSWAFRYHVENLIKIHPTYLSLFLLFSVFLKMHRLVERDMAQPWWDVSWNAFQIALMLLCSLLLSSRGPLIAFGVALLVYFIQVNWKRTIIGLAAALPIVALLFINVPAISGRFSELTDANRTNQEKELNSVSIRFEIFKCTSEILSDHWLLGVGIGNVQPALDDCYVNNGKEELRKMQFNTHNQYAHVWMANGLPGLIIFILMLGIPLYLSIRKRDIPYQVFLLMVGICFFTENLLDRQHGVVFFAFFNTLFAFHLISPIKR